MKLVRQPNHRTVVPTLHLCRTSLRYFPDSILASEVEMTWDLVGLLPSQDSNSIRVAEILFTNGGKKSASPKVGVAPASRSLEEGLECPVCWESFDDTDNTPYVLWCGHSLCKNCVLNLEWATVKLSGLPLQLPLFICCPWCQFLTVRFKWKGQLRYPCKNFFLLWVVESLQGEHGRSSVCAEDTEPSPLCGLGPVSLSSPHAGRAGSGVVSPGAIVRQDPVIVATNRWGLHGWRRSGTRLVASFSQFMVRVPLVLLFLFILVYVLPFSTLVLAIYCIITVLFAVPSFLVVYFSYPSLDWLVRAIAS